jgi:hypothetical protein
MRKIRLTPFLALGMILSYSPAEAQEMEPDPIAIGTMAPDFELPGATRYGVLRDAVKLSDFNGDAVVLAFFFRARTRG